MADLENKEEIIDDINDETSVKEDDTDGKEKEDVKSEKKEKTFTQAQVTAMMAKEKKQGRKALLNELGYKDEKSAKTAAAAYKSYLESQKTEEEKAKELEEEINLKIAEAEERAVQSEAKVEAMLLGAKKNCVEDVVALVMAKSVAQPDGDFKTFVGEIKDKYPSLFEGAGDDESDDKDVKDDKKEKKEEKRTGQKGTGGNVKVNKDKKEKDEEEKSFGARLAANRRSNRNSGKKSLWS